MINEGKHQKKTKGMENKHWLEKNETLVRENKWLEN